MIEERYPWPGAPMEEKARHKEEWRKRKMQSFFPNYFDIRCLPLIPAVAPRHPICFETICLSRRNAFETTFPTSSLIWGERTCLMRYPCQPFDSTSTMTVGICVNKPSLLRGKAQPGRLSTGGTPGILLILLVSFAKPSGLLFTQTVATFTKSHVFSSGQAFLSTWREMR